MKVQLSLGLVLACVFVVPSKRPAAESKPPAYGEEAIGDNSSARVNAIVGSLLAEPGDLKCGLPMFEEAARLDPHSAQAHYNLGKAHGCAQHLTAAAVEFRLALQEKPGMTMAHQSLGS